VEYPAWTSQHQYVFAGKNPWAKTFKSSVVGMQLSALQPFGIAMIPFCWNVKPLKLPSVTLTLFVAQTVSIGEHVRPSRSRWNFLRLLRLTILPAHRLHSTDLDHAFLEYKLLRDDRLNVGEYITNGPTFASEIQLSVMCSEG